MELYVQTFFAGVANGSIYALVGLGFTIIYLASNVLNLAQGSFVVLGGLIAYSMLSVLHLPMALAFAAAIALVAIAGIVVERVIIHPLLSTNPWKETPAFILVLITLGAMYLFEGLGRMIWGVEARAVPHIFGSNPVRLLEASILPQTLVITGVTAAILLFLLVFFRYTSLGRAMRACAENKVMASMLGINIRLVVMLSFALSAALGAIAGMLVTPIVQMTYLDGGYYMFKGCLAAIVGGLEKVAGPVIGGFTIGLLESFSGLVIPGVTGGLLKGAISLALLIVVLLIRPRGLLGETAR